MGYTTYKPENMLHKKLLAMIMKGNTEQKWILSMKSIVLNQILLKIVCEDQTISQHWFM